MNRPKALNALSKGMFLEFEGALRNASEDRTVSFIILKGEGRAFSAGLDVKEVSGFASRSEAREFVYDIVKPFWKRYHRRIPEPLNEIDRKSTRLNSSHANISYAVFCLKKKKKIIILN